jgi:small ubiquitin-related modifier
MRAFCQRQGVAMESVRFLFDGNRIRENQTPNELEMEDGDSIDVVVAQVGGTPTTR